MNLVFPFLRDAWYPLSDLRAFEDGLRICRRADADLDQALRVKRDPWMKLRADELYPLMHLAKHLDLSPLSKFKVEPEGSEIDVRLETPSGVLSLQVTTAGPMWPDTRKDWGYDHSLMMKKLNQEGQVSGWGPFRQEADGTISNREEAISTPQRDPAYLNGLIAALKKKAVHRIPNCELVVHAVGYTQAMDESAFKRLAGHALQEAPPRHYRMVHILDEQHYIPWQPVD